MHTLSPPEAICAAEAGSRGDPQRRAPGGAWPNQEGRGLTRVKGSGLQVGQGSPPAAF